MSQRWSELVLIRGRVAAEVLVILLDRRHVGGGVLLDLLLALGFGSAGADQRGQPTPAEGAEKLGEDPHGWLLSRWRGSTSSVRRPAATGRCAWRVTASRIARIDFSIDPDTGRWRGTPLEQVAGLLTETAQQQVLGMIARSPLASVLADGIGDGIEADAVPLSWGQAARIGLAATTFRLLR
jgi:hypothetical protein